jgi:hypothetical protein
MNMRGIHYKRMRGKSNVIKRNVEIVWGARYTLGARYLRKIRYIKTVATMHQVVCEKRNM